MRGNKSQSKSRSFGVYIESELYCQNTLSTLEEISVGWSDNELGEMAQWQRMYKDMHICLYAWTCRRRPILEEIETQVDDYAKSC